VEFTTAIDIGLVASNDDLVPIREQQMKSSHFRENRTLEVIDSAKFVCIRKATMRRSRK
jgi:hypothetical protein